MKLGFISCSGACEHTNIEDLVKAFGNIYLPEIVLGIQVSGKKASFGSARYWWLRALYGFMEKEGIDLNISLHVNQDWVERFIQGDIAEELDYFLNLDKAYGLPFIKTVQLNFRIGREKAPNAEKLIEAIKHYRRQKFILSCSQNNVEFIKSISAMASYNFWLLYDESFGEGIKCDSWKAPLFDNVLQGYAGGLSSDNVLYELKKIDKVVEKNCPIFIDAEGKLKGEDGHFSTKKAQDFVNECCKFNW